MTREEIIVRLMQEIEGMGDRLSYSELLGEEYDENIETVVEDFINTTIEAHS